MRKYIPSRRGERAEGDSRCIWYTQCIEDGARVAPIPLSKLFSSMEAGALVKVYSANVARQMFSWATLDRA